MGEGALRAYPARPREPLAILTFYFSSLFAADLRSLRLSWRMIRRRCEELLISLTAGAALLVQLRAFSSPRQ
ncbi:hypothetical protein RxyAA322_06600 [Rubrobacter xylanophilus]|uniref:Uncharacterized protein n=1 Tax=Rubrobacter xylanophilus TaxID=49319 RepID=A0A510HFT3_9ACTN|nr:hypothetical protein RxyAA322_06600 [Rubrobacter xylanophilus]